MSGDIPKSPIRFGIFASKPHKKWVIAALVAVFIASISDRFFVLVLKNLTDAIATQPVKIDEVWKWAIAYPLIYVIGQTIWRASGFTGMRWMMGAQSTAYQTLYEYLSQHSKEYFNNRFAGSLTNKISNAVNGFVNLFQRALWRFLPLFFTLIVYIIFTGVSDWRLGIIIAIWAVVFLGANAYLVNKLRPYSYEFAESLSTLKGRIVDSLSNISLVHEYAYIGGEHGYIERFVKKQHKAGLRNWLYFEWVLVMNGILIALFMFFMIGTAIYLLQQKIITIGVVVMVVAIVGELSSSFFFIGSEMSRSSQDYGEAQEGLDEILHKHIVVDDPKAKELRATKGKISFESIDFKYDNQNIFENFSLNIPGGEKAGLVGRSGAGKTTLVSLLLRHFDVQGGAIKIDGQNIHKVTLDTLRRAIAFVPQDTSLFHRSIFDNIRYSKPDATKEEVVDAAKKAQADKFIRRLKRGYGTVVGERGVKLSGGQRQRIAIARAFLKDSPILVLDEATSSLDSESEKAIQESLAVLMRGRTVIAIAHRLSTLKEMSRIVVIEEGKIVEDGRPEDLLKKIKGFFKNLWDHQVSGFILDE
ncbi:ABC transporter ATP-binding protein [Candidatus Roizmanbacteria bacterium]|nr:ABC transporter ATP-binding protein [Candidatus Roizmanbacteria bacterium]